MPDEPQLIEDHPLATYKVHKSRVWHAAVLKPGSHSASHLPRPLCASPWFWPSTVDEYDEEGNHAVSCGNCLRMRFYQDHILPLEETRFEAEGLKLESQKFPHHQVREETQMDRQDSSDRINVLEKQGTPLLRLAAFHSIRKPEINYMNSLKERGIKIAMIGKEDCVEVWQVDRDDE